MLVIIERVQQNLLSSREFRIKDRSRKVISAFTIWTRVPGHRGQRSTVGVVVAGICRNIWREKYEKTFNNTTHNTEYCIFLVLISRLLIRLVSSCSYL